MLYISVLRSWRWAKDCPKYVELIWEINKLLLLHLVGFSILLYLPFLKNILKWRSEQVELKNWREGCSYNWISVTAEMKIFGDRNGLSATSLIFPGHFFLLDTYNEARQWNVGQLWSVLYNTRSVMALMTLKKTCCKKLKLRTATILMVSVIVVKILGKAMTNKKFIWHWSFTIFIWAWKGYEIFLSKFAF